MMRLVIQGVSLIALLLALSIAVAGPGTRFGLWEYGTGLTIIREAALPALVATGAAALAFVASLFAARSLAPLALVAAVAAGGAGAIPLKMKQLVDANPFIHDVTTDFDDPPAILAAADLPRKNPPEYLGGDPAPRSELTVAQAQQRAFPDIAPKKVSGGVEETAEIVRAVMRGMGMKILRDGPTDAGWTIEAAYTSFWFGFVDDFVVRLRSENGATRVDVRSKSRVGGSDLGANARRVREFYKKLDAATA